METAMKRPVRLSRGFGIAVGVALLGSALAQQPAAPPEAKEAPEVAGVSSAEIYKELTRRARAVLSAPAEVLAYTDLPAFGKLKASRGPASVYAESDTAKIASVYDDAVAKPSPGENAKLSDVPEVALAESLVARSNAKLKTLYGTDDRMDLYHVVKARDIALGNGVVTPREAHWLKAAEAVGYIIEQSELQALPNNQYLVSVQVFGEVRQICNDGSERFWKQPYMRGMGTAFLVGEDRIVTASHCLPPGIPLDRLRLIFGYALWSDTVPNSIVVRDEDIYRFKKILARKDNQVPDAQRLKAEDWAVLQLTRKSNRAPLKLGNGKPAQGSAVYAIGHCDGLPVKLSPKGTVREALGQNRCFLASVDASGGNSGSPVLDESTHEVHGILIRGNEDFAMIPHLGCMRPVIINDQYEGETIGSISRVQFP
jgi:hypothetical protein